MDASHGAADGMCLLCRDVHRDVRLQDAGGQAELDRTMGEESSQKPAKVLKITFGECSATLLPLGGRNEKYSWSIENYFRSI